MVTEAAAALGFEPELTFEGPVDSAVPETSVPEVLAVLREALSNVARHARATRARDADGRPGTAAHARRRGRRRRAGQRRHPRPRDGDDGGAGAPARRGCILEARPGGGARLAWWATLDDPS